MEQISAFLHYMAAERGAARNTIDAYRNDLTRFAEFAVTHLNGATATANGIDRELIAAYDRWLRTEHEYAQSTIIRKLAALKSFCAFLLDHGNIVSNPAASIVSPRAARPLPRPMTTAQVEALLLEPLRHPTGRARRDAAMLELMYATGLRVSEFIALDIENLHLSPGPPFLHCPGTGARERTIPLTPRAVTAMWHYLETRGAWLKAGPQPALFLSHSGHRLSRHGFWLILTAYAKAAGINEHVSPHMLRHSFATQALRAGTSLREVQRLLGHANDSTTRAYTHLPDASPLERSELLQHRAG